MTEDTDTGAELAITLDPDLSPAAAEEAREAILKTLNAAVGGDAALPVNIGSDDVSSTALQLLVSITKTAERDNIGLDLSANAKTILASVEHA